LYARLLDVPLEVRVDSLEVAKPLLLWINDGLMAIFFLLIGLEVKREVREGQLSKPSQLVWPGIAAIGGMLVPSLIYVSFNRGNADALSGWAIPAATDIAFALGVVSLLGRRVPQSLKIFLLTLAILDDLAAITIIAIFYTADLALPALVLAALALVVLIAMNRLGVSRIAPYVLVGIALWVAVLKSGVHATLAGVAVGLAIPLRARDDAAESPLKRVEHALHPWVAYGILPLFAFANAGLDLRNVSPGIVLSPVSLGIIAGLAIGKPLGIFGLSWLAIKMRLARLPEGVSWLQLYGIAQMCGIGFTMSLFIATLAFEHSGTARLFTDRLGILIGSLISALVGYAVLRLKSQQADTSPPMPETA
ncbi:MAG: Na+/H+ antiporter NhaA, partial [Chloroflexi bacterium]